MMRVLFVKDDFMPNPRAALCTWLRRNGSARIDAKRAPATRTPQQKVYNTFSE